MTTHSKKINSLKRRIKTLKTKIQENNTEIKEKNNKKSKTKKILNWKMTKINSN